MKQNKALIFMGLNYIISFRKSIEHKENLQYLIPRRKYTYSTGNNPFLQPNLGGIIYRKDAYVWNVDSNRYTQYPVGLGSIV